ncbi:cupin domain-containing protein [Phyllosticta paracitricarpa]|uniref:Cupin domain-containing protein n=2 Tax=Phyllosticta TaxID=121621 RepID=A0ABR1MGM6_9PEZI
MVPKITPTPLSTLRVSKHQIPGWCKIPNNSIQHKPLLTTHFHSTTHEVLAISQGRARLCFGGEGNEGRVEPVVSKDDVVVVPAGVGHRLVEDVEGGFEMVGSYPLGCHWDMCYGKEGEEAQVEGIKGLRWLESDPVYGDAGPAVDV